MTVREVQEIMEAWAPPDIAWERDNVGLQVGDPDSRVRGILVSLDATETIVDEAFRRGANLIITHHPLLFRPLHSVTPGGAEARCVMALVKKRIALFSAHTNLDFARGGTSFALADTLGLLRQDFLRRMHGQSTKIVTFVPATHVDAVALAMSRAGAGIIGNYDQCSFRTEGTGTFRGSQASNPVSGSKGRLERVREVRLEMIAPRRAVREIVQAIRTTHPYEEVAYDLHPLDNVGMDFGMGVIGELRRPVRLSSFIGIIRRALGTGAPRFTGNTRASVRRVAVCGGSGGDMLDDAIAARADAFITADIKYHSFHQASGRIALVDAGHYETEYPVVRAVVERLRRECSTRGLRVAVRKAKSTNPMKYGLI